MKRSIFKTDAKWNVIFGYGIPFIGMAALALVLVVRWLTK